MTRSLLQKYQATIYTHIGRKFSSAIPFFSPSSSPLVVVVVCAVFHDITILCHHAHERVSFGTRCVYTVVVYCYHHCRHHRRRCRRCRRRHHRCCHRCYCSLSAVCTFIINKRLYRTAQKTTLSMSTTALLWFCFCCCCCCSSCYERRDRRRHRGASNKIAHLENWIENSNTLTMDETETKYFSRWLASH